jgi:hypothetical protein
MISAVISTRDLLIGVLLRIDFEWIQIAADCDNVKDRSSATSTQLFCEDAIKIINRQEDAGQTLLID